MPSAHRGRGSRARRDRLLGAQVRAQLWWGDVRARVWERGRDEAGDAYTGTVWVAIGIAIAIVVGGILYQKFQTKAEGIDTNTPTGPLPR